MNNFDRCLRAVSALSRHLSGRGTSMTDIGDSLLVEAAALIIADRGRAETASVLRLLSDHVESANG